MRRIHSILLFAFIFFPFCLRAQEVVDSLNLNVFENISEDVTIYQSEAVRAALESHVKNNARLTALGITEQNFSIRIFSDNGQNARSQWNETAAAFTELFPGVPVAKTFDEPFFKVTVGNYTSKADANAALKLIQLEYPSAFIVRN